MDLKKVGIIFDFYLGLSHMIANGCGHGQGNNSQKVGAYDFDQWELLSLIMTFRPCSSGHYSPEPSGH